MALPFLAHGFLFLADETPDSFTFTDQTNKNAFTLYESDIKQINGISVPVTATTSGGSSQLQVSTNADGTGVVQSWASSVTVQPGQYLRARLTTGGWSGTTSATINVGIGFTDVWSVTTSTVTGNTNNYGVGTNNITIPAYNFLTVKMWAPGGGGGGVYNSVAKNTYFGGTGGQCTFNSSTPLAANGGTGGGNGTRPLPGQTIPQATGSNGSPGTASGGDFNTTGGGNPGGAGGSYPGWGLGGVGGAGGFVQKTWALGDPGAPVVGNNYSMVIASGGASGPGDLAVGGVGSNGSGQMSWS